MFLKGQGRFLKVWVRFRECSGQVQAQGRFLNRFESSLLSSSQELRSACVTKLGESIILDLIFFN